MPASVYISRLLVEEGFLDGLDISFSPGLNVIIGARGVGKTSIVQLLRFCLGVPAFGDAFEASALAHAQNVLGVDGRVSVRLMVDGEPVVVSRRKQDDRPEGSLSVDQPIILAQTEVEEIAVDPRGRLRLLDDFRGDKGITTNRERALVSTTESLTIQIAELTQSIDAARQEALTLETEKAALKRAEEELANTAGATTGGTNAELARLDVLGRETATARVRLKMLDQAAEVLGRWVEILKATPRGIPAIEMSPPTDGEDPLAEARDAIREAGSSLETLAVRIARVQEDISSQAKEVAAYINARDDEARDIRRRVEEVEQGAGLAARRLAALRERVAQLTALTALLDERESKLGEIRASREEVIALLDDMRTERFNERLRVAKHLGSRLAPQIQISVQQSGDWSEYSDAIADAVRGSGLHYSTLAPALAKGLTPAELADAIERDDAKPVAKAAGVPADRARRVIDRIKECGLGKLLTAPLQDAVELKLLDGTEYKRTEELSTGQRCTTVLPILLQHENRPVILDQPEDHLDGAFIVETLVQAVLRRGPDSQLIASTHNPNIPVLGEASQVTLLGSDGHRGYQLHSGPLDDEATVKAITSVMEGGQEAFERRARFYGAKER